MKEKKIVFFSFFYFVLLFTHCVLFAVLTKSNTNVRIVRSQIINNFLVLWLMLFVFYLSSFIWIVCACAPTELVYTQQNRHFFPLLFKCLFEMQQYHIFILLAILFALFFFPGKRERNSEKQKRELMNINCTISSIFYFSFTLCLKCDAFCLKIVPLLKCDCLLVPILYSLNLT